MQGLTGRLDVLHVLPGGYLVQVEAGDVSGNTARVSFPLSLGPAV